MARYFPRGITLIRVMVFHFRVRRLCLATVLFLLVGSCASNQVVIGPNSDYLDAVLSHRVCSPELGDGRVQFRVPGLGVGQKSIVAETWRRGANLEIVDPTEILRTVGNRLIEGESGLSASPEIVVEAAVKKVIYDLGSDLNRHATNVAITIDVKVTGVNGETLHRGEHSTWLIAGPTVETWLTADSPRLDNAAAIAMYRAFVCLLDQLFDDIAPFLQAPVATNSVPAIKASGITCEGHLHDDLLKDYRDLMR